MRHKRDVGVVFQSYALFPHMSVRDNVAFGLKMRKVPAADIATRVYNHTWKIDPIIRSVIDTDFYKLLMAQTIWKRHRDVEVTFGDVATITRTFKDATQFAHVNGQQAITLGAVLVAAGWAAWHLQAGRPWTAAAGVALIGFAHALVLAFEVLLVRATHGADPTPRASLASLSRC